MSAGTLQLNSAGALATGSFISIVSGATLNLNSVARSLGQLSGAGNVTLGSATLTIGQAADTTYSGAIAGTGGLTKSGIGALIVSGTNSYTGATALSAGRLIVNGSAANSAFTVSGGILSGTGTTGALSVNRGGTISPGNSPGILSSGATTFAGSGAYVWEINNATGIAGTNYDLLNISGSLNITATNVSPFTINLTSLTAGDAAGNVINFNSSANYSYTIATASGGISGFGANKFALNTGSFSNGLDGGAWSLSQAGNNLNLNFTASAIPEPSTYAALAGLAALGLAIWRRRSHRRVR